MSALTALVAAGAGLVSMTLSVSEFRLWTFLARSSTNWLNLLNEAMGLSLVSGCHDSIGLILRSRASFDRAPHGEGAAQRHVSKDEAAPSFETGATRPPQDEGG